MEQPSADAFLEAFDGRFYGPVSPPVLGSMHFDWGAYDGSPSSLGLVTSLAVGKRHERLVIRNGLYSESTTGIVHGLLFRDPTRPFRFPLLVERAKMRIPVDGRDRVFTTYTYRGHVVATTNVRGLTVTMGCRNRLLPALRLGALSPDQLRQMIRDADEFSRNPSRRSRKR